MVSGQAIKVNTPGMKISIKSKIARRIHIAESRSDNQFRYIKNKIARRIHILIGDYILTYKKSAERPLECCQKFRFPMNFNMVPNNFFVGFGGKTFNT